MRTLSRLKSSRVSLSIALAVSIGCLQVYSAGTIVVDDDMSSLGGYSSGSFNSSDSSTNLDDISFESFSFDTIGGNPAEVMRVLHTHDVNRDEFGEPENGDGDVSLQSFVDTNLLNYNPATDGTINDISFFLDIDLDTGVDSFFSTIFFSVHELTGGSFGGFTSVAPTGGFQSIAVTGLTNADFSGRDFAGSTDLGFGFGFLSSGDVFFGSESIEVRVDNFRVVVNTVPEPTSAGLFAAASLLIVGRRRPRVVC